MKKAVGYLRVSSKGQKEGSGFDRQRETIDSWGKAAGFQIVTWYEEAVSGTEADREAFSRMITDLLSNGIRTVAVESLDRLARDLLVQSSLLALLASKGIELYSASTGASVTQDMQEDPMRKALIQIQGIFAELEKSLLVRKLRKARESKKASTGICEGRKPFGTRPGESETLTRMKALARSRQGRRLGPYEIAARLNEEGLPSRSGKPWHGSAVQNILAREMPAWSKKRQAS